MKRNLLAILLFIASTVAINSQSVAQSILVHYWNFNSLATSDSIASPGCATALTNNVINPIDADYSSISTTTATVLYREQPGVSASWPTAANEGICYTYYDAYPTVAGDYDTMNLRMGAAAGNALRTRNPSDSMELLIYMPTTHYSNILLQYGCERSGSGMLDQLYDFSIDSGHTFSTTGLTMTVDTVEPTFMLYAFNLAACVGVSDNRSLVFRIRFNGNNNTSNGNNRFDNITVDADTLSNTTGVGQMAINPIYNIYPNPVANTLVVNTNMIGDKTIVINNIIGQRVYDAVKEGVNFNINTSDLTAGVYYMTIHENSTGNVTTMKFVKQ